MYVLQAPEPLCAWLVCRVRWHALPPADRRGGLTMQGFQIVALEGSQEAVTADTVVKWWEPHREAAESTRRDLLDSGDYDRVFLR